jgi:phage FluMu gp28-like protein
MEAAVKPAIRRVTIGLDLGHSNDLSALAILEQAQHHQVLRQASRFPLGALFTHIVEYLAAIANTAELAQRTTLVVDATGLGAPVVEMLRRARIGFSLVPVVITAGHSASLQSNGTHHVPKKDLVTALHLLLATGGLRIPARLPGYTDLKEELLHFHANISDQGRATFASSRDAIHDDLVMALALAAWQARPKPTWGDISDGRLL